jgi:TonB-dependent starch-binding outer membrane protein SusC
MNYLFNLLKRKSSITGFIVLLFFPVLLSAQTQREIKGKVVDDKNQPVSGITVAIKGTTTGAATGADGSFSINAKDGDVLVFSGVSFETQELKVTSLSFYSVSLNSTANTLSDVVVVGYGKNTKRNLSSSVSSLKPEELNRGAIGDVGQLLQGKVAGLNITASGDPNRPAAVILRGASTVNSPGGPFYVIDGVPGADIAIVAPDDIASIDVLKDAAATAIYGNRAANGVIIITTRRGKKGQAVANYNGYVGIESVSSKLDLMDANQLRDYITANGSGFSPNDDKGVNTDWMAAIQRSQAISHNHNLSLSGGGEKSTYSASLNYFDKEGILNRSKLRRVIGRLSLEQYALNDKIKLGLTISNASSNANYVPLQNVVLLQAAKHMPISPVFNPDGTYFENLGTTGYFNPVALVDNAQDDTKYNTLTGNFTAEVKLPLGLTYNLNISYQNTTSLHGEYYGSYYGRYPTSNFYNNPDPGIGIAHTLIGNLFGVNGSAFRSSFQNTFKAAESFLTWNRKFGNHNLTAVIGYSWQETTYGEGLQVSSTNFPSDNLGYTNLVLGNPYGIPSYRINLGNDLTYGQIRLISDFGRLNYNYKDKYLLQASLRRDGSSVFGENNAWGLFPSVSAAWRASGESFMQNQKIFNDLKLRFSYGVTGNSGGIGAYTSKLIYGITGTYYNNGIQENAYGPIQGSNPDLQWEEVATTNVGLDFAILNNKVTGTIDWYNKNTTDMLFNYRVSASLVPGGNLWANGGSINNKGLEISLTSTPVRSGKFSWSTTLNMATNKNEVTSLQGPFANGDSIRYSDPEGPGQTGATLQLLKVGKPIGQFFTLEYAGKNASGVSQFTKKDGTLTTAPAIGTDYYYAGNAQPKFLMGWNNNFKYGKWDLNVFLRGVFGNEIFNATRADLSYVVAAAQNNILATAKDDKITDNRNSFYSTRYIEKGNYIRLDNATLSYSFGSIAKGISSLRVYATGNNLFTITKYSGIDPEINQGGVSPGIDYNNFFPKTRTVMFGLNLTF